MTVRELGESYKTIGERLMAMDQIGRATVAETTKPAMSAEQSLGAAAFLCYLRDLLTGTPKETFDRAELLVLLEITSEDAEIFPHGVGRAMWDCEPEELRP